MFDSIKRARIRARRGEEALYAAALREIEAGVRRDGLWAQAVSQASGNESRALAVYLALVVRALKDGRAEVKPMQESRQAASRKLADAVARKMTDQERTRAQAGDHIVAFTGSQWECERCGRGARKLSDFIRTPCG